MGYGLSMVDELIAGREAEVAFPCKKGSKQMLETLEFTE